MKMYSLKQWEDSGEIGKKEAEKYRNYKPIPFKDKLIITIQYNPKKATVKYLCGEKKVKFKSEIHNKCP
jgi:hypothetical protein